MNQIPHRPLYIFDLDGTISLPDHRRHLVEQPLIPREGAKFKPQWDLFYDACDGDSPNWPVIGLLIQLYQIGCDIEIWSGRSEAVKPKTIAWLFNFLNMQPHVLTKMLTNMRPDGDTTPDHVLKRKWLNALSKQDRARIGGVFDDRQKVVDMWRGEGLTCFQVAPGNF